MPEIRGRWKQLAVVVLATIVVATAFGFGRAWSSIAEFYRRLDLADLHAPKVMHELAKDDRFRDVRAESFTGSGGVLLISGTAAPESIADLRRIVYDTEPPVLVRFFIDPPVPASRPARAVATTARTIRPD